NMFCGYLIVRRGHSATVRLKYVVPPNAFAWSRGSAYRLVAQHQPGSRLAGLQVAVDGVGVAARRWKEQEPATDLVRSTAIEKRSLSPISLPRQPATVVAPGRWIEPHAYL